MISKTFKYFTYITVPSKYFLFPKTSSRRLEDVSSITIFRLPRRLEDVLKTYLEYLFQKRLQGVFKMSSQDVFKTFSRRFQDVLARRLQEDVLQLCLEDLFKMTSRRLARQKNVTLKTSSVRIHQDE